MSYPSVLLDRLFLLVWAIANHTMLPFGLIYLKRRARKEPLYWDNLAERFGAGKPFAPGAIWVHAVSLGELRAAKPLLDSLLDRGERIVLTCMSSAGHKEAHAAFGEAMTAGQMIKVWCPLDLGWAFRRFLRHYQPRLGIVLETELWPQMIAQSNRQGVPLTMLQAQYPEQAFQRDRKWLRLRGRMVRGFDLILAKSDRHKARFEHFGATDVRVMGEMRFEQPIPQEQIALGRAARAQVARGRKVICLASTALDEDPTLIPVISDLLAGKKPPFIVYVPRHPKDFDQTHKALQGALQGAGRKVVRRSEVLNDGLSWRAAVDGGENVPDCDVLFGDSLGEIYFYFAMTDLTFIGDTFNNEGSHNVIEPLAVGKPVVIGPSMWGIEYPGMEALEAGVLTRVTSGAELLTHWQAELAREGEDPRIAVFCAQHGGATQRALHLLEHSGYL